MSKVLTGARAKVFVNNQLVGIFEGCTHNRSYGAEPIHLLGRYSPDEIVYTSAEAVTLSCTGFKVVGQGVHVLPAVPKVQDLLNFEALTIAVVDRQTNQTIMTVIGCIPNGDNGGFNARASSRVTVNYIGTIMADESGAQSEGSGAVSLP